MGSIGLVALGLRFQADRGDSVTGFAVGELAIEIGQRDVIQEHFGGIPQTVVDEAHVGTPALVADDGVNFLFARLSLPELPKVAIEIAQVGEFAAQFAGAHVAVVVDDDGRLGQGWDDSMFSS